MSKLPYTYIIGLEIHIELNTASKMFSAAPNDPFHVAPNEHVTPICIGMPGTLPVPNRQAIVDTILLGLALNCQIAKESKFDRKHYFYPDLPKGYQISQYDQPLAMGGELTVDGQTVRLTRIHLEEDAGKLLHLPDGGSAVDLNRAGVPLMEIVTEPDLTTPAQARAWLKELRAIARALHIADADMEKGQLRCDANVNIAFEHEGQLIKTYISEIKNLNSFRMVERALVYEAQRLYDEWLAEPAKRTQTAKITVGWDNVAGVTKIQRHKEGAADYRYFPEPDIPPLRIYGTTTDDPAPAGAVFDVAKIRERLVALPSQQLQVYLERGVSVKDAATILKSPWRAALFEAAWQREKPGQPEQPGLADNAVRHKLLVGILINDAQIGNTVDQLLAVVDLRLAGQINSDTATKALAAVAGTTQSAEQLIADRGWLMSSDADVLKPAIMEVLAEQAAVVADYRRGKTQALGFLVGQVMRKTAGSANPQQVAVLLEETINQAS